MSIQAIEKSPFQRYGVIVLFAFIVAMAFQGSRGLFESSEGRYAECAREMIVSGAWLEPTLDGHHHWTKPPMTYWAIAAGLKTAGMNEWGARLYLVIAFVVTSLLVSLFAERMFDRRTGFIAGIVYATALWPASSANMVTTDVFLTMWETAAVLCYWFSVAAGKNKKGGLYMTAMWVCFGFAFLTKGPPGMMPLTAIVPYHIIMKRRGDEMPGLLNIAGLLFFTVLGIGYYLLMNHRYPGLLANLAGAEIVERVSTEKFHRNPQWYMPFAIYLPIMLLGCAPWVLYWPMAMRRGAIQKGRALLKNIPVSRNRLFLVLWMAVPLVLFSLFKSRLALYVLPLMAPVAVATARAAALYVKDDSEMRKVFVVAAVSAVLIVSAKAGFSYHRGERADMRELYRAVGDFAGGKDYDLTLYMTDPLWGLQFYERRHIGRIGPKKDRFTSVSFQDKIDRIEAEPGQVYIFVAHPDRRDNLAHRLEKRSITFDEKTTAAGWRLFKILANNTGGNRDTN